MRYIWNIFPDYRETVPYQTLLERELSVSFEIEFLWLAGAVTKQASDTQLIFHMHWQNAVYNTAKDSSEAVEKANNFSKELLAFKLKGGKIIWTVHNLYPHENIYPEAESIVQRAILELADVVHTHSSATARDISTLGFEPRRIVVYPHPSFLDAYPNHISKNSAREYFGMASNTKVFSFLGMIRDYKGLDILKAAFNRLWLQNKDRVALIVAGQAGSSSKRRYLYRDGIYTIPRYVEDSSIQYVFNAADYGVLPYRNITTSGALMLGFGFGRPMIIPNLPQLLEFVTDRQEVIAFEAGDLDDLAIKMTEACDISANKYLEMSGNCHSLSRKLTFAELASILTDRMVK